MLMLSLDRDTMYFYYGTQSTQQSATMMLYDVDRAYIDAKKHREECALFEHNFGTTHHTHTVRKHKIQDTLTTELKAQDTLKTPSLLLFRQTL